MTKISELQNGMKKLVIQGFLTEKADVREVLGRMVQKTYKVCNFLLSETAKSTKDNSITLVIWDDDIDKFRVGDKVQINNGYTTSYQEQLQLNVGRYGTIKLASN
jgi:hypothetical protein